MILRADAVFPPMVIPVELVISMPCCRLAGGDFGANSGGDVSGDEVSVAGVVAADLESVVVTGEKDTAGIPVSSGCCGIDSDAIAADDGLGGIGKKDALIVVIGNDIAFAGEAAAELVGGGVIDDGDATGAVSEFLSGGRDSDVVAGDFVGGCDGAVNDDAGA